MAQTMNGHGQGLNGSALVKLDPLIRRRLWALKVDHPRIADFPDPELRQMVDQATKSWQSFNPTLPQIREIFNQIPVA